MVMQENMMWLTFYLSSLFFLTERGRGGGNHNFSHCKLQKWEKNIFAPQHKNLISRMPGAQPEGRWHEQRWPRKEVDPCKTQLWYAGGNLGPFHFKHNLFLCWLSVGAIIFNQLSLLSFSGSTVEVHHLTWKMVPLRLVIGFTLELVVNRPVRFFWNKRMYAFLTWSLSRGKTVCFLE